MSHVTVNEIDPADETLLRQWWEVGAASTAERPLVGWPAWEVSRTALPMPRRDLGRTLLVAELDGRVVGAGLLVRFLLDNTHLAELDVQVLPDHRRHGVGGALLRALEDRAVADGRTTLVGTAYAPLEGDSAGSLFAAARGYPVASREETKACDLATAPGLWPALDEQVTAGLGGYRVELFEATLPERWVDDFCHLMGRFADEIPSGDLDVQDFEWTADRLREHEERMVAIGKVWFGALGVTPDGRACGFTELAVTIADPGHAEVGGTLVLPEHRGHRLGLGMKLASHRRLLELFPDCAYVETSNAGVNAPMNAVNEALGYRVVERCLDVQKVLERVAAR
ncbi:GNAT family N-acetyltransferase [Nocardioides ferulae]|uniref:GNAT family N-acetyltransferase n=1 Tax=Nocardioides ferulae TaxID=2340821 RepID=UPI000F87CF60|nr:GNAT family N-acetyltransferase [Nocardioides ferulae]